MAKPINSVNRYEALRREEDETCPQQESKQIHCVNMVDLVFLADKKMNMKFRKEVKRRSDHVEKEHTNRTSSLMEIRRPGADTSINNLGRYNGWKEIGVTIHSGACDTAVPLSSCSDVLVKESQRQRGNLEYEVANGENDCE